MILFSNAKINIGLHVTSKRSDGFHNIESLFYPIPLFDVIEILPWKEDVFQTSGLNLPECPNLVKEAYQLLKSDFNFGSTFIHLHKRIPLGSGLGGGSSNAAFTLLGLNHLYKLNLSDDQLKEYAAKLGSDCVFFIENTPSLVSGRGEIITRTDFNLNGYYIKVVHDGIHVSTPIVFRFIKPEQKTLPEPSLETLNSFKNDFESIVFDLHPELLKIKQSLEKEGAIYTSMSGSGSAIYGIYDHKPIKSNNYQTEVIFELK